MFTDPEPIQNVLPQVSDTVEAELDVVFDDPVGDFPEEGVAFRLDQLKIMQLGSQDENGFITMLLDAQWVFDVDNFNLNIILMVHSYDDSSGAAEVSVGFGVGGSSTDLCFHKPTRTEKVIVSAKELEMQLGFDFVSIYSEDVDGTSFNCTPAPETPDGVPLRSVTGELKVDASEDGQWAGASGTLLGCLSHAEGEKLCSCVGTCSGKAHEACGGCPDGSAPLTERLGDIVPTAECSSLLGEDAYDLRVDFTGERIPIPEDCP